MKLNFIPQPVKNYGKHLPVAILANLFYFFPSRKIKLIGVTGTDGKTTTTSLIHHLLCCAGKKAGMTSTVVAKIAEEQIPTGLHVTSPSPFKLQKFLAKMRKKKMEFGVLEVTSHALDQFRFWGCRFLVGVITNVTHEHLDYHKTFTNYLLTKAKLLQKSQIVILNRDDTSFPKLKRLLKGKKIITYGLEKNATLWAKEIKETKRGVEFVVVWKGKEFPVKSPLWGRFNVYNQLAALGAVVAVGIPMKKALVGLSSFKGVEGRMERIENNKGIEVIVDFAHTPNGLKNALETVKRHLPRGRKLIAVFGAAGLRDKEKRPMMGKIAASLADYIVLTSEDPRTENPRDIARQIAQGCRQEGWRQIAKRKARWARKAGVKGYFIVLNRQEAINFAIRRLAQKGDWVVALGKGHERSMPFGKTEYPWSEHEAVRIALRWRRKK